jgi:hypothetical protein
MTLKTYTGSCHCGTVRFKTEADISSGTWKCNCSSCTKARSWLIPVSASHYQLTAGAESEATYQWTPPGRSEPSIQFHFCKRCGIRTPGRGDLEVMGGAFFAVQVCLLDDVDPDELATAPIQYIDGRNEHWTQAPADIRLL